jgi:hypothetical protein
VIEKKEKAGGVAEGAGGAGAEGHVLRLWWIWRFAFYFYCLKKIKVKSDKSLSQKKCVPSSRKSLRIFFIFLFFMSR